MRQRKRRTATEIEQLKDAIVGLLSQDNPQTVRQVFYRLVALGLIPKTEAEYKHTVCRLLTDMRLSREIPFEWIADNTRWVRKPQSWGSVEEFLREVVNGYRRSRWQNQDVHIQIWLEKDALAGVFEEITAPLDVALFVGKGYSSLSFLNKAAQELESARKPAYIYYFGDHDPSGLDITRCTQERLREFAPNAHITFQRVAVTEDQIRNLGLPTRPTKQTDSRSKSFRGDSVELDAIPASVLRRLVRNCIEQHIDLQRWQEVETLEAEELATLAELLSQD